jgi:hypothetical protein
MEKKFHVSGNISLPDLVKKLGEVGLDRKQKKVFRELMKGGVSYGVACREINESGECLAFATIKKLEYENAVDAIVSKMVDEPRRELAFEVASAAYFEANYHNTNSPRTLRGLRKVLAA